MTALVKEPWRIQNNDGMLHPVQKWKKALENTMTRLQAEIRDGKAESDGLKYMSELQAEPGHPPETVKKRCSTEGNFSWIPCFSSKQFCSNETSPWEWQSVQLSKCDAWPWFRLQK